MTVWGSQVVMESGFRLEGAVIDIAPDWQHGPYGGIWLVAPEPVDDVVIRDVVIRAPWLRAQDAPIFSHGIQFQKGGRGIRIENVRIEGAPSFGLRVRGASEGTVIRNVSGERIFTLVALHEGPHLCAVVEGVAAWNGWRHPEKHPDHDPGLSRIVEGRHQGWSAFNGYGLDSARIEGVTAWGEMAGLKVTHSRQVIVRHCVVPNLMVQESDTVSVHDSTINRRLADASQRNFNAVQLYGGRKVHLDRCRIVGDGSSKYAVQVSHGAQAVIRRSVVTDYATPFHHFDEQSRLRVQPDVLVL